MTFLYYFLPAVLALYFITPTPKGSPGFRNLVLLTVSLVFYAWGEPVYVLLMAAQCVSAWAFGLLTDRLRGRPAARVTTAASVVVSLSGLIFFKYTDFFIKNVNGIFGSEIGLFGYALPLGISFYTFQIISYTVDLYRGTVGVRRSLPDFSAYVTLFPQLIAGPIVRYSDVARELSRREHSIEAFSLGVRRFVTGLGKKVLIANVMGELVAACKQSGEYSLLFAWLYVISYGLQIYYDFSGYSDMAIGLGQMFGFKFPENFNYPYTAKSISDFWRQWHMSLSGWFRDYVYVPLGGSRKGGARYIFNVVLVWGLTGFWHGADWNYILWGLYFAAILLAEKFFISRLLEKSPGFICHAYVLLLMAVSWVLFDGTGFSQIGAASARLFGFGISGPAGVSSLYYLRSYLVPLVLAAVGCTPLPKNLALRLLRKRPFAALEAVGVGVLLIVITAYLADGSFNPFIYFRF